MPKTKNSGRLKNSKLSRAYLLVFVALFALVGGLVVWRLFAVSNSGILEAERMRRYAPTRVFSDTLASGKKGVKVNTTAPAAKRRLSGYITTGNVEGYYFTVVAKATPCRGHWPSFEARLSGPASARITRRVSSLGWHAYNGINVKAPAGKRFAVNIRYTTLVRYSGHHRCRAGLYFDVVRVKPQAAGISGVSSQVRDKKGVTVTATIDTHGKDTAYYAEYGTSTDYGYVTKSATLKGNSNTQTVKITIDQNLLPNTAYHYRVCTVVGDEVNCSADFTFTTGAKVPKTKTTKGKTSKTSKTSTSTTTTNSKLNACGGRNTHDVEKNNPCPLTWKERHHGNTPQN